MATPNMGINGEGGDLSGGLLTASGWGTGGVGVAVTLQQYFFIAAGGDYEATEERNDWTNDQWIGYQSDLNLYQKRAVDWYVNSAALNFFYEKLPNFYRSFALRRLWEEQVLQEKNILEGLII